MNSGFLSSEGGQSTQQVGLLYRDTVLETKEEMPAATSEGVSRYLEVSSGSQTSIIHLSIKFNFQSHTITTA